MNLLRSASAFLILLVSTGLLQAEMSQHFDRSGRLVSAPSTPQAGRLHRYSVPEGIELRPDVQYEFYAVFGKTFAEIVRSTEENGPRHERTRKRQPSAFTWSIGWTFDYSFSLEQEEDSDKVHCDISLTEPVLSYNITATLPALTDDSALNPMEKELWRNYVVMLIEQMNSKIRIIRDDSRDSVARQFGEIAYISLSDKEADNAERIVERYVRSETEKIGSKIVRQIQQKLDATDSGTVQDSGARPAKPPSSRRITR